MSLIKSLRGRRIVAGLAVGGVLLTAACTNAAKDATQSGTSGPPVAGGTLAVAQSSDATPSSFLSPALGNILTEYSVFETLTLIDPNTGQPKPVLATSWKIAPDGLSMSIQLRHGVTFHSGKTMTSADVIYTIQQMQNPAVSPQGVLLAKQISSVKATGDYEVDLTFKRPMPNIFDLFDIMPIVNKDNFSQISAGKVVDGTGPFVWKSWIPGSEIVLQKYAQYRNAKDIRLNSIDIDIITDPTAELAAIQSGRVQYAVGLSPLNARSLGQQSGYAGLQTGGAAFPVCFNVTQAPFDNKLVRQAVQYAIDRQRIVQQVEGGLGQATDLPWKTVTAGYDQSQGTQYTYDPNKAKQLLAQAGVKSGTSFTMVALNTPEVTGMAQIIKNNLAAVGLNATIQALSDTDFNARVASTDMGAPAFLMQNSNAFSPATQVQIRPELRATGNVEHFQSPEYTKLVNALTSAVSPDAQKKALYNYNQYFLDQAFCLPEVTRQTLSVRSTQVDGIAGTWYGFLDLNNSYLVK